MLSNEETLEAHLAKFFNTNASAGWLAKKLPASSSYMAPISAFVRRKLHNAVEDKKYSTTFASKEPIDMVQTLKDDRKPLPRRSDYTSDELPRGKWLKLRSNCHHD